MDIKRIEEYNFSHGLHRDNPTGKFYSLQPHTLGRPLTHEEMDYNMLYMEQTLGGYKIFGSNADTSLSDADVDKSLVLHRITPQSEDYARYTADGYFSDNELIWIPSCCGDTTSGEACNISGFVSTSGQASPGQNDVSILVSLFGLQGVPQFYINNTPVTWDSIDNVGRYVFNGYGQGTYQIYVIDSGVNDYVCDLTLVANITEQFNPCEGFSVSLVTSGSGGEGDPIPCELEDLVLASVSQPIEFGSSNGWVELTLSGSWTDSSQLVFTFDGDVKTPTPQTANGPTFRFENLEAGEYTVYVVDSAADVFCAEFVVIEIPSEPNPCEGFTVNVTTTASGGETLDCGNFGVTLSTTASGGETLDCGNFGVTLSTTESGGEPDACVGFGVNISTAEVGGTSQLPPPSICQDFQISLSSNQTGIYVTLPEGTWGDLTFQYSTTDPSDPSTIFTDAEDVTINQDGTFLLSGYSSGDIWIRVEESNNQCTDIERVTVNA